MGKLSISGGSYCQCNITIKGSPTVTCTPEPTLRFSMSPICFKRKSQVKNINYLTNPTSERTFRQRLHPLFGKRLHRRYCQFSAKCRSFDSFYKRARWYFGRPHHHQNPRRSSLRSFKRRYEGPRSKTPPQSLGRVKTTPHTPILTPLSQTGQPQAPKPQQ